jgi:CRP-like cAMP-binding protein
MPAAPYQRWQPPPRLSSDPSAVALDDRLRTNGHTNPMTPATSNLFLSGLSPECLNALLEHCTEVDLPVHTILYEAERPPRYAYFLTSGLASVVTSMSNGGSVEVGFIGLEGIVGSLQLLGSAPLYSKCEMQLAGKGMQISLTALQQAFDSSDEIRKRILEFVQEQSIMLAQIAGCNRLHSAEERLVRWLLMAQDRTHSDVLRFTHEHLAELIGTRRTTVTVLAGGIQAKGFISYSRGKVCILNRVGLEAIACSCYAISKSAYSNLYRRNSQNINGTGNVTALAMNGR